MTPAETGTVSISEIPKGKMYLQKEEAGLSDPATPPPPTHTHEKSLFFHYLGGFRSNFPIEVADFLNAQSFSEIKKRLIKS